MAPIRKLKAIFVEAFIVVLKSKINTVGFGCLAISVLLEEAAVGDNIIVIPQSLVQIPVQIQQGVSVAAVVDSGRRKRIAVGKRHILQSPTRTQLRLLEAIGVRNHKDKISLKTPLIGVIRIIFSHIAPGGAILRGRLIHVTPHIPVLSACHIAGDRAVGGDEVLHQTVQLFDDLILGGAGGHIRQTEVSISVVAVLLGSAGHYKAVLT